MVFGKDGFYNFESFQDYGIHPTWNNSYRKFLEWGYSDDDSGQFKPSVYQLGKRSRRMPRWLVLRLTGVALGAGRLIFLQTNYGPQRLIFEQSEQLHTEINAANQERQQLQSQLAQATEQRDSSVIGHASLSAELTEAKAKVESLSKELQLFQDAMPPDPRGGPVGIRSGALKRQPGQLNYQILVMRDAGQGQALKGAMTFTIEGTYPNGRVATITPEPVPMNLDRYNMAQGKLALPDEFSPRIATIRVLDSAQRQHAMRIFLRTRLIEQYLNRP